MKIQIISHPLFFGSKSMPRFAHYLSEGMQELGYPVEVLRPKPYFNRLPVGRLLKKWLGYLDQYVIFSMALFFKTRFAERDQLFVLSDHALGLWAPIIADKAHVVHCHDFLALKSAKGEISANPVGATGRLYQKLIYKGFSKAHNFISVSKNTKTELESLLPRKPRMSAYVYNGLNPLFEAGDRATARQRLGERIDRDLRNGYFLHVGGNQFYKNRVGIIKMYDAWRHRSAKVVPLLLIGTPPVPSLRDQYQASPYSSDILFCSGLEDEMVKYAYQGASIFLFPSLAEGFGWPIAEAMACGCPVITTDEAPMNEVGGGAAIYIEHPKKFGNLDRWAEKAAEKMEWLVALDDTQLEKLRIKGIENSKRFDSERTISQLNELYIRAFALKYGKTENA